ncbi:MAG: hypothetical protein WC889_10745, partial [Myxococcota bacterium]
MKRAGAFLLCLISFIIGCTDRTIDFPALKPESGFAVIKPVTYQIRSGERLEGVTTDEARMWYSFRPADTEPEKKPLAVFFNGGPGCTTAIL